MQHYRIFYSDSSLRFPQIAQLYPEPNHLKFVILQISSPLLNRNRNTPNIQQKIKVQRDKLKKKITPVPQDVPPRSLARQLTNLSHY